MEFGLNGTNARSRARVAASVSVENVHRLKNAGPSRPSPARDVKTMTSHMALACACVCQAVNNRQLYYLARSWASAEYWKYFMAHFDDVHAFGNNFAESGPIWMKSGLF